MVNPGRYRMMIRPETYLFADDGHFPNSKLPLLVYRAALPSSASAMEDALVANGWSNGWRDGIITYHHFHSIAHEVLGIARARSRSWLAGRPAGP